MDTVLLLHAAVADRRMWDEHLGPLREEGFDPIAPDLPGFGDKPEPPGELAPWNDVLEDFNGRAVLVGNSMGANVALRVAVVAPERVAGLVLIGARMPGVPVSEQLDAAWTAEGEAAEAGDIDGAVQAVVDAWTLPDAPQELRDRVAVMQQRALELQMAAGEPEEAPDPLEAHPDALQNLEIPVLIAVGEHDMPDFHASADKLADQLPNASRHVFMGAGHLAPLEKPDEFREVLLGFLRAS